MAKAGVNVKWTDRGLENLEETLAELGKLRVTVGIQGADAMDTYPDGTRVAAVGLYNEYGTRNIPARGFMRRALKTGGQVVAQAAAEGIGGVVSRGEDLVDGLGPVGATLAHEIQTSIERAGSWATPNAPATIEKKGPGKPPLHDTGRLARSISWAVKESRQVKKTGRP